MPKIIRMLSKYHVPFKIFCKFPLNLIWTTLKAIFSIFIFFCTLRYINTACIFCLTCGPTHGWRNGDAQCCQLSNIADPFSDFFFPKKSAQTLFSLRESPVLPHEHEVLLSQHAHTPLSLSLRLSAQFLFSRRTHISLSLTLSASDQFLFSARQRREKLNSVKHRYYVICFSNFTCKYSQNHSTAIVIILWVFYLIRHRL